MNRIVVFSLMLWAACACGAKQVRPKAAVVEHDPAVLFEQGLAAVQPTDGPPNFESAYLDFARAGQLSGSPEAYFNAGLAAEDQGNAPAAIENYREAYARKSDYEAAVVGLGRVLRASDQTHQAIEVYHQFLADYPTSKAISALLVDALAKSGRYEAAHQAATERLFIEPANPMLYQTLAAMYAEQGQQELAQLCYEKALALAPSDPAVYNNMGTNALVQEQPVQAVTHFDRALQADAQAFEPQANLGFLALQAGDYPRAVSRLSGATTANPGQTDVQLGLAIAYRGNGDYDRANDLYDALMTEHPTQPGAYFNAATLYEKYTKNYGKAIKTLQSYVNTMGADLDPNHPVFARLDRVKQSKAEADARKAEANRRAQEEAERAKRNQALLKSFEAQIVEIRAQMQAASGCIDQDTSDMGNLLIEQTNGIIEVQEYDLAPDIKAMLDGYQADLAEQCGTPSATEPAISP